MRTKPCWSDSFILEILRVWLLGSAVALVVGLLLLSECTTQPAHAGAYLDIAGGMTQFLITAPDGDYIQRGLPRSLDTRSLAYRVGLGWSFNERWSIQGSYVNFGTINQTAKFVSDEDYNPKGSQCVKNCAGAPTYRITDAYHGGELTVSRHWEYLYLKLGGAYLMHRFTINNENGLGQSNQHYGQYFATVAGAGVTYKVMDSLNLYGELSYYHGLGGSNGFMGQDQGWPLSKEQVVMWFGVKIPLS